jgi:Ca2+-binding RTX toxin-like protein
MDLMINVTTLLNSDLANAGYDTIVRIYFPEDTSSGSAVVNGSSQADYVFGSDLTNDTLSGVAGNDYLYGGDGADLVSGGSGDDLIVGGSGAGDDTYIGGLGTDTASPWYPPGGRTALTGAAVAACGAEVRPWLAFPAPVSR